MARQDDILSFWFADLDRDNPVPKDRGALWFGGAAETDEQICNNFQNDVERARAGAYDDWGDTPRGSLALIVLLDQFPRNIYRKTPAAFASDAKALSVCLAGIEAGQDRQMMVVERAFFYLPMEHSEDLDIQEKSVESFRQLIDEAAPAQRDICESYYDYALRHHEIIARFHRFPHRNSILGRESTPEEVEFLKQPGSSF
jgi:uncharacterized protein (DUF924 family)